MKEKALDLLRKYIDLQIALEIKHEWSAAEDWYDEDIPQVTAQAEKTWKALAGIEEVNREWIRVSDRLPEIGREVLVRLVGKTTGLGCLTNNEGCWFVQEAWESHYKTRSLVTHWMLKPNPPESEGKCKTGHTVKSRCAEDLDARDITEVLVVNREGGDYDTLNAAVAAASSGKASGTEWIIVIGTEEVKEKEDEAR